MSFDYLHKKMKNVISQGILDDKYRDALHVDWHILRACNNRCSYCYDAIKPKSENYSWDDMRDTASALLALNRPYYSIRLVGGEPTIHPHLIDLVNYFFNSDKNVGMLIITNGSRHPAYFEQLLENVAPGAMDIHISIHLEKARSEHIIEVIKAITSCGQHVTVRFMADLDYIEKGVSFHNDLVRLRKEVPFATRLRALRQPPDFIELDSRYEPEDLIWMEDADRAFVEAEKEGPVDLPLPAWGTPQHRFLDFQDMPLEHNNAMRAGLTNFLDFYCCAGTNLIRIKLDYRWSGAVCPAAKMSLLPIYSDPNFPKKAGEILKCPFNNCGCDANYVLPKFRNLDEAEEYLAQYRLRFNDNLR